MTRNTIEVRQPVSDNQCRIWPEFTAKKVSDIWNDPGAFEVLESPRAGGSYRISEQATWWTEHNTDEESQRIKARLTTVLLNAYLQGNAMPMVTSDMIQRAKNSQPLPANERAERLLRHIVNKNPDVGVHATLVRDLDFPNASRLPLSYTAMAWSESTTLQEVEFLLDYLRNREFVILNDNVQERRVTVTVQGHSHIADQAAQTNSSQAFVAMWFDESMDTVYSDAIEPAIRDAGYRPFRIDQTHSLRKVDDEIIAQIRLSKFVVADFTHGVKDVRGSVYYEAGFAHGLNLPVIFAALEGTQPHFDTRQYPHIMWKTPEELRTQLTNRILALPELGRGPNVHVRRGGS